MSEIFYYGLSVQSWLLLGIVIYVFMVILLIYVRYCVTQQIFCASSTCHLHLTHIGFCCRDIMVNRCSMCGSNGNGNDHFCCTSKTHGVTALTFPKVKCRCFAPTCSYLHCFCCEIAKLEQVQIQ